MKIINPKSSDKILKKEIGEIKNATDAKNKFFEFYKNFKIAEETEEEADMMLFQYGYYDFHSKEKDIFSLDFTRQFAIPDDEEYLQLSMTLFYKKKDIGELSMNYNSWSEDYETIEEWEKHIMSTEGFISSKDLKPLEVKIMLDLT